MVADAPVIRCWIGRCNHEFRWKSRNIPSPPDKTFLARARATLPILVLTPVVLFVHGYHPLADDGAVYAAGIKKLANPGLYPFDAVFVLSPTHVSIFAHVLSALLRWTPLPLPALLLLCHLASIFLFLLGCRKVAECVFSTAQAQRGAVLLAACCFTLPVAGTSLDIMDPYVTARSFSTPLSLFALAAILEQKWLRSALWLALVTLLHPLMAAYATIALVCVALAQHKLWRWLGLCYGLGWTIAGIVFLLTRHADPHDVYNLAALSRSYFFLSRWQWYEYPGLAIPLLLVGGASARVHLSDSARAVTLAFTGLGSCALLTAVCFVHGSGSFWLARLQVLRSFQWVYLAGVLLAGGLLGTLAQRHKHVVMALYLFSGLASFAGQRLTYPASYQVEWPGRAPSNPWQQAFLWIREHTPGEALFALDNDYIEAPDEDSLGFRAAAERSAVADYYKDGGIASNFPQAAGPWWRGSQATAQLNHATDAERLARLRPLGVTWIVLATGAPTGLFCPYTNAAVRVCRLSPLLHSMDGAK